MKELLKWIYRYIRSALIAWFIIKCLSEALPLMSDLAKHVVEGAANTKAIGGAAGAGWLTTGLAYIDSAAPNILIYLSIAATILTIIAWFSNRKRQKVKDMEESAGNIAEKLESEARRKAIEEDERRKEELHKAELSRLSAEKQEAEARAEAQSLFTEMMVKKRPDEADELIQDMAEKVICMAEKKKAQ